MKSNIHKTLYTAAVVMVGLLVSSCSDYLDTPPKSSLEVSVIFSSPDLAKGAVDGIKLPFGETNSYRGRYLPWYGLNTDVEWYNSSQTAGDNADLAVYNAKPNNTNMNTENNAWAMMYSSIERANICIEGLRLYGDPLPDTEMGYLLGEALTLRAIVYADLLKTWGDVVARFEPIATATIYLPKSSRDEIYKRLIADLEEASTLVPWPNETAATSNIERINKAFVKGLRARLCLAASGYSQYPDGIRRSNDPELSVATLYAVARKECEDVINSGTAKLEPMFETVFKNNNQDKLAAGGEALWELPFADGRGRMLFTFAVRHQSADQHTDQARGGQAGPVPSLFYDYDLKDTRRDVTCVPYQYGTADQATKFAKQELVNLNTWFFGKYRYEWMARHVTSTNDDGVNKLYMRYAEILFMAAETANELDGPTAAAPYLKAIRQRAFASGDWPVKVDAYINGLDTKEAMFSALVEEHKFEFAGEMERKQALIRWNLLKTKLDETKANMHALKDRSGAYQDVPSTVYAKYAADGETLLFYGLNRGESGSVPADYTLTKTWTELADAKIESLYTGNPDTKQFWPIWQVFLDGSNGKLVNDYGY
jgi:starch-binding outer membrane protein, SusD/RagB family